MRFPRARRVVVLATSASVSLSVACGGAPDGPEQQAEVVTANFQTAVSFAGQQFPSVQLTITGSGSSSAGNVVTVNGATVDGTAATSPVVVAEGSHLICVTATSSTAMMATHCRTVSLAWPRFVGRSVLAGAQGITTPGGLSLTIDDEVYPITSTDGSFSIPSTKALSSGPRLLFNSASPAAQSLLRFSTGGTIKVVMLPRQLSIPSCSVYGGQLVTLDFEKGFASASAGQSAFLDRASTLRTNGRVVVASWNASSIPVALSDTGGPTKRFSAEDSSEVATALSTLTSYVCQSFHFAPLLDAVANGVVIFKDPTFAALGSHAMALPATRGDYIRADVILRSISPSTSAGRDSTRRTVMHEFLHVLGFGHTCSWPSVMTTGTICQPPMYTLVPSPQDVAHYFAMRYAREGERALISLESLGPAYLAALVANGQTEVPLFPYFNQP